MTKNSIKNCIFAVFLFMVAPQLFANEWFALGRHGTCISIALYTTEMFEDYSDNKSSLTQVITTPSDVENILKAMGYKVILKDYRTLILENGNKNDKSIAEEELKWLDDIAPKVGSSKAIFIDNQPVGLFTNNKKYCKDKLVDEEFTP